MAQGEFWVERQNWARWPRVLKVHRVTESGTETRRYLPERHKDAWNEREYAVGKIAELQAENAKLRELAQAMPYCMESKCLECPMCTPFDTSIGGAPECRATWMLSELGVEVSE